MKNNNVYRKAVIFLVIVAMLGAILACAGEGAVIMDGNVYGLQLGSTLWGIKAALAEKSGTFIMNKDNLYMFGWAIKNGWAFSVIDPNKLSAVEDMTKIFNGNQVNVKTMTGLVDFLKANGWQIISASEVPAAIATSATNVSAWLVGLSKGLVSFLVVPFAYQDGFNKEDYITYNPEQLGQQDQVSYVNP